MGEVKLGALPQGLCDRGEELVLLMAVTMVEYREGDRKINGAGGNREIEVLDRAERGHFPSQPICRHEVPGSLYEVRVVIDAAVTTLIQIVDKMNAGAERTATHVQQLMCGKQPQLPE